MTSLEELPQLLLQTITSSLWRILATAIGMGFVGALGAVGVVFFANRLGLLERSHRAWKRVAQVNWVYLPLVIGLFGLAVGFVLGAQRATSQAIHVTSEPLIDQFEAYLPPIQEAVNRLLGEQPGSDVRLEDLVDRLSRETDIPGLSGRAAFFFRAVNLAVLEHLLDQLAPGKPTAMALAELGELDLTDIDPEIFALLPQSIDATLVVLVFLPAIWALILGFAPFVLLPVVEWLVHWAYARFWLPRVPDATA